MVGVKINLVEKIILKGIYVLDFVRNYSPLEYMEKQFRKNNSAKRNKSKTIGLIKNSALSIINNEGIKALKASKIERSTGKSRKLIYDYFGDLGGLLSELLSDNDPWISKEKEIDLFLKGNDFGLREKLTGNLLLDYLDSFLVDNIAKEVARMEVCEKENPVIKGVQDSRERFDDKLFSIIESNFAESTVDIRLVFALLLGGINYLVLHSDCNESQFCGIDLRCENGVKRLKRTLKQISSWAYQEAEHRIALKGVL